MALAEKYRVDMPISRTVYEIVRQHQDPKEKLMALFLRAMKRE